MTDCHIYGCRNLETHCKDCGRLVNTAQIDDDGWLDVKDRVPEEYLQEVLGIIDSHEIVLCCYNTISKMWTYNCTCNIHEDDCECRNKWPDNQRDVKHEIYVTHWMPLPNPPKEW